MSVYFMRPSLRHWIVGLILDDFGVQIFVGPFALAIDWAESGYLGE